jgi:hypothetical protein
MLCLREEAVAGVRAEAASIFYLTPEPYKNYADACCQCNMLNAYILYCGDPDLCTLSVVISNY